MTKEQIKEKTAALMATIKLPVGIFLSRLRINYQKLLRRCPRQLRVLSGPLLGGLIGLIGGIPGFFIGLIMGYFIGKLFAQSAQDRRILDYFVNPGKQEFYEGENGLAAWCGLCVLVISKNKSSKDDIQEKILRQVILETMHVFISSLADPFLIEHFTRLAWSNKDRLNTDLLAESLAARRASKGDSGNLGQALYKLAVGEKARSLAREIRQILEPMWDPGREDDSAGGTNDADIQSDPWKILGLLPGTPHKEIKAHYRRLAKQFHPDELQVLDEKQRQAAAKAFIAIKEAYKEVCKL